MSKRTNLQVFAELFAGQEGLDEFLVANFNNQNELEYEFNGTTYYLFTREEVQDILNEDFETEDIFNSVLKE